MPLFIGAFVCWTYAMFLRQRVMVTVPYKMPVRISKDEAGEVPVPLVTIHTILKME